VENFVLWKKGLMENNKMRRKMMEEEGTKKDKG
jgi:hypothetical protein